MNHKDIGSFFQQLRESSGLTRHALSKQSGLAPMTVRKLEEGSLDCRWSTLVLFAKTCGSTLWVEAEKR